MHPRWGRVFIYRETFSLYGQKNTQHVWHAMFKAVIVKLVLRDYLDGLFFLDSYCLPLATVDHQGSLRTILRVIGLKRQNYG